MSGNGRARERQAAQVRAIQRCGFGTLRAGMAGDSPQRGGRGKWVLGGGCDGCRERKSAAAARQLRRNPGFTATVIVTLALAIGANTAIFSIVNALLVKPLPYLEPQRMGTIFTQIAGGHPSNDRDDIDGAQWEALRDNVPSLDAAVYSEVTSGANLRTGSVARYVHDGRVSAQFFDVLGVRPALGRGFTAEEDRPKGPAAAVLSYDLWRTTFGADRGIIWLGDSAEERSVHGGGRAAARDSNTALCGPVYATAAGSHGRGSGSKFWRDYAAEAGSQLAAGGR